VESSFRGWTGFWEGRLGLDDIAWEITELCDDIASADQRQLAATDHTLARWQHQWPNVVLLSVLGV